MIVNLHKKLLAVFVLLLTSAGLASAVLLVPAYALSDTAQIATAIQAPTSLPQVSADQGSLRTILNIVFGIIGSLAVLMIVLSSIKYITSSGDSQKTSEARNGIFFALLGLTFAILAQAIVTYVVNRI